MSDKLHYDWVVLSPPVSSGEAEYSSMSNRNCRLDAGEEVQSFVFKNFDAVQYLSSHNVPAIENVREWHFTRKSSKNSEDSFREYALQK